MSTTNQELHCEIVRLNDANRALHEDYRASMECVVEHAHLIAKIRGMSFWQRLRFAFTGEMI